MPRPCHCFQGYKMASYTLQSQWIARTLPSQQRHNTAHYLSAIEWDEAAWLFCQTDAQHTQPSSLVLLHHQRQQSMQYSKLLIKFVYIHIGIYYRASIISLLIQWEGHEYLWIKLNAK